MSLLCKGCGQSLVVPETSSIEPDPIPPPIVPPNKPTPAPIFSPPEQIQEPHGEPRPPGSGSRIPLSGGRSSPCSDTFPEPEPDPELPPPPPKKRPRPQPVTPSTPEIEPEPAPARKKLLPIVVDLVVGLVLLAIGVLLGEMLAKKPTAHVWHDAGGAVKFPPEELILWMGPPALISLVYVLLVSKGLSVGGWLKRH